MEHLLPTFFIGQTSLGSRVPRECPSLPSVRSWRTAGSSRLPWNLTSNLTLCAAAAAAAGVAALRRHPSRCRMRKTGNMALGAPDSCDRHASAVRKWLSEFVLGRGFCPWARPADEAGGIRVVASAVESEEAVLEALRMEAAKLPEGTAEPGEATTTLVVFPKVRKFASFGNFYSFFTKNLKEGNIFFDKFGLKIVAFHPQFDLYGASIKAGDVVAVAGPDGEVVNGTVLNEVAGVDPEDGEEFLEVRFADGNEYLVKYSCILGLAGDDAGCDNTGSGVANIVARAPRPTFHLLRLEDLDRAHALSASGHGPDVQAVLERNEDMASELGLDGMKELLQRCG